MNMFIKTIKGLCGACRMAPLGVMALWAAILAIYGGESVSLLLVFGPVVLGISFLGALFWIESSKRDRHGTP